MKGFISVIVAVVFLFTVASCSLIEIKTGPSVSRTSKTTFGAPKANVDITGSISLAHVWAQRLSPPHDFPRTMINLKEALTKWSAINATIEEHLRLDSPKVMSTPIIYILADKAFELTAQEIDNLRNYVSSGGLLVLDNATPQYDQSQAEASLRKMVDDVLGHKGRLVPIPKNHDIYHCYFDFSQGPPLGIENQILITSRVTMRSESGHEQTTEKGRLTKPRYFLEGVHVNNRLAILLCNKGYGVLWNEYSNNDQQLKFGINLAVYTMTAPGGIR